MLEKFVYFFDGEFFYNEKTGESIASKTSRILKAKDIYHLHEIIKHVEETNDYEFCSMVNING